LRANPLLDIPILLVKRRANNPARDIAIPAPHETNSHLKRTGWDNELAVLDLRGKPPRLQSFFRPADGGYVGEGDLHFDVRRILFTQSDAESWKLWEMNFDGTGRRQVSQTPPDVDCFDGSYPKRLVPEMYRQTGGRMTYTRAYDALIHTIRRVGIEDTVDLLEPGAYHADTSPLV
jgi:hypothetical protein